MQIHSVFHISLLKPADPDTPIQTESSEINLKSQNVEYEVKNILNQQKIQNRSYYLIE